MKNYQSLAMEAKKRIFLAGKIITLGCGQRQFAVLKTESIFLRQEGSKGEWRGVRHLLPGRNSELGPQFDRLYTPHHRVPGIDEVGPASVDQNAQ